VHFSGEFWRTSAKFLELYTTITVQTRVSKEQQTIKYLYVDIISDASIVTVCASTVVGSKSSDPSQGPIQVPCVSRTSHFVHGCIKSLSHASTAHPEMVSPNVTIREFRGRLLGRIGAAKDTMNVALVCAGGMYL
jgi:hypothetical protein